MPPAKCVHFLHTQKFGPRFYKKDVSYKNCMLQHSLWRCFKRKDECLFMNECLKEKKMSGFHPRHTDNVKQNYTFSILNILRK